MSLSSAVTDLATRVATEFNTLRGSIATSLSGKQASSAQLSDIAGLSPSANDVVQYKSGHWANRTIAQLITDLTSGLAALFQPLDLAPYAFTYASTYAPNWNNGPHHYCTGGLTGDITIQEPTNIPSGKTLRLSLVATTSARTVVIDSTIQRIAGLNSSLVVEAGKVLILALENNPALSDTLATAKAGT